MKKKKVPLNAANLAGLCVRSFYFTYPHLTNLSKDAALSASTSANLCMERTDPLMHPSLLRLCPNIHRPYSHGGNNKLPYGPNGLAKLSPSISFSVVNQSGSDEILIRILIEAWNNLVVSLLATIGQDPEIKQAK